MSQDKSTVNLKYKIPVTLTGKKKISVFWKRQLINKENDSKKQQQIFVAHTLLLLDNIWQMVYWSSVEKMFVPLIMHTLILIWWSLLSRESHWTTFHLLSWWLLHRLSLRILHQAAIFACWICNCRIVVYQIKSVGNASNDANVTVTAMSLWGWGRKEQTMKANNSVRRQPRAATNRVQRPEWLKDYVIYH